MVYIDVREKEGLSIREVAKRFDIRFRSVVIWLQRLELRVKRNKPTTKIDMAALAAGVKRYPDSFLRGAFWRKRHGDPSRAQADQGDL